VDPGDLARLHRLLLASGADIAAMNAVRKRFARWGAGRLAAALAPARVHCLVASDVIGDDLETIGSGPCVPDRTTARDVAERLTAAGLAEGRLPSTIRDYLDEVARGRIPETPKPGHASFDRVTCEIVLSNADAVRAVVRHARRLGWRTIALRGELHGEAVQRGAEIAQQLRAVRLRLATATDASHTSERRRACLVCGGETTVTIGDAPAGALGGRCQELALSAARTLRALGEPPGAVTLLAAGTDGRDGPTDAAGAIVDPTTWGAVRAAGRDPEGDLARHDSHRALDAAGALVRTGLTGTNVMDVVIALVEGM
jgi:glycerate-2-kinase